MLDEMSARQFAHWVAFYRLEGFGEAQAWYRHGAQMALTANIASAGSSKEYKASDFIPEATRGKKQT